MVEFFNIIVGEIHRKCTRLYLCFIYYLKQIVRTSNWKKKMTDEDMTDDKERFTLFCIEFIKHLYV